MEMVIIGYYGEEQRRALRNHGTSLVMYIDESAPAQQRKLWI